MRLLYDLPGGAHVLFTTRAEGNMSSLRGAHREHAAAARERLRARLGLRRIARGRQVHGSHVVRVGAAAPTLPEADGQATADSNLGALVLTADCLPVAIAGTGAVAMLHAGWRGLAAGVLEEGVSALRELGARAPLHAVIGPGAGPCCYEVDPEVHAALAQEPRRGPFDLAALAHARLTAAGVEGVRVVEACTICDSRFFSYRREGEQAGRQAGVAWLS